MIERSIAGYIPFICHRSSITATKGWSIHVIHVTDPQDLAISVLTDMRSIFESFPYRWICYNFCSHEQAFHLEEFSIILRCSVLSCSGGSSKNFLG
jgi:hypothetical protein